MNLHGAVRVPGSKSITHRAAILAAAGDRPCNLHGALRSDDTHATLACLQALGATVEAGDSVRITPGPFTAPDALDCKNAGTALRLLTAQVARHDHAITLTGDSSLQGRPNGPLHDALRTLGATVSGHGTAPFTITGPIRPGRVAFDGNQSSQYASAILLALPLLDGASDLELRRPVLSRPYLDVTLDVASAFGLRIEVVPSSGHRFDIHGGDTPRRDRYDIEPDWSTAAFPLAAGALAGDVTVQGLRLDSKQGDRAVVEHLRAFGAHVDADKHGVRVRQGDLASPGTIDVTDTPDLFPVLAVLAAAAHGTTTFTGGQALRHKESDRIDAVAKGLQQLGIEAQQRPDGLIVHGGTPTGGQVDSRGDHRIHMAFTLAGLAAKGKVHVTEPSCVAISYPAFHDDLARLEAA